MLKANFYPIVALAIAVLYWLFETAVHTLAFNDPLDLIPHDPNEIWMRTTIFVLILGFGFFARFYTAKLVESRARLEALKVNEAESFATQHVLNNLLNEVQLMRQEAENHPDFDQEVLALFDQSLAGAKNLIRKLTSVDEVTAEEIRRSVMPVEKTD